MKTATVVPPLRQSIHESMSCEYGYSLVHIQGFATPDTAPSIRGTDVHEIVATYAHHCAQRRIPADFAFLDSLCDSASAEVATILDTCRENLTIDWENFFGAEVNMGLDADFQPTYGVDHDGEPVAIDPIWGYEGTGKPPEYCGIVDAIYIMPGGKVARLRDLKTHPRPFPADTFQGSLYSLMLMMHLPELEEVEFGLHFVRYANLVTTQKYYRSDVPKLMAEVRRARDKQVEIHEKASSDLRACAGSHCVWCPSMLDPAHIPCPIRDLNPMLNMSPSDRLNFRLWLDVANRVNNKAMQDFVDGSGQEITGKDGNGKSYTFGPVEKVKVTFPLFVEDGLGGFDAPIVDALSNWAFTNPEDLRPKRGGKPWFANLRIGSTQLKSYLKAKKREIIDNAIKDLATSETKVELRITRDAEVDDGQGEEHREYDTDEVHEFQA